MAPNPNSKHKPRGSGTTGTKVIVTAASLAAILAGWAGLTIEQKIADSQAAADPSAGNAVDESGNQTDQTDLSVSDLPPLPTLVPEQASLPYVSAPAGSGFTPAGQNLLLVNVPANAPAPNPSLTNSSSPNNKLGSNGGVKKAGSSKPKSGKSGGGGTAKTRAS